MAGMTQEKRKLELIKALQQYQSELNELKKTIKEQAYKELNEKLEEAKKFTFSQFYKAYEPKIYKRTGDLKNAIEINIEVERDSWEVLYTSDNFKIHTYNGDYILDRVFDEGWHGGDDGSGRDYVEDESTHPDPGTPWWHKINEEEGSKNFWVRKAVQSEAPRDMMDQEIIKCVDFIENKYTQKYKFKKTALKNRLLKRKIQAFTEHYGE